MIPIRSCTTAALVWGLLAMAAGEPAVAGDPIDDALEATFRITNKRTSATAFLVWPEQAGGTEGSRPVLVTAAHSLEGMTERTCTLVVRVRNDDATYARREIDIALRDGDKQLWVRHPGLDVAVLLIDLPEGTAARPLQFGQLADVSFVEERKVRAGSDVYIPGYPATLEGNDAGWPVLRKGVVATHPLVPIDSAQRMFVNANTFGGDSGAPVILANGNDAVVVGIVTGMQRQTSRSNMPFEERVSHMPMALAITVPAPFIRQTIELLGKGEDREPQEEKAEEKKGEEKGEDKGEDKGEEKGEEGEEDKDEDEHEEMGEEP